MKTKLKIMKTKPLVSDDEIQSFMDFDNLMTQKEEMIKLRRRRSYLVGGSLAVIILTALLSWLWLEVLVDQPNNVEIKKETIALPGVADDSQVAEKVKTTEKLNENNQRGESSEKEKQVSTTLKVKDQEVKVTPSPDPSALKDQQLKTVYVQAEPADGYPALYEYFDRELTYPAAAVKDSIQGIVTVIVTINSAGKPEKIKAENSLGKLFEDEALRVIENMPPWKPAMLNGKPVASTISMPLTFQLQKVKNK